MSGGANESTRVWITWETQRRNKELAQSFRCAYFCFEYPGKSSVLRYLRNSWCTLMLVLRTKPAIVFAQCPSLGLVLLLGVLRKVRVFVFIIDAHNVAVDHCAAPRFLLRSFARFSLRTADIVLVSNQALAAQVAELGGTAMILPDKVPQIPIRPRPALMDAFRPSSAQASKAPDVTITLISTFAFDEPIERFLKALDGVKPSFILFITGKKDRAGDLLGYASERVHFTDFLPDEEYEALIQHSDLLVDLSTQKHCLVCGAYEAIAVGVPVLLSDDPVVRDTFPEGCLYARNSIDAYVEVLDHFFAHRDDYRSGMRKLQHSFPVKWQTCFTQVEKAVEERARTL